MEETINQQEEYYEIDLFQLLKVFWQKKWFVFLVTLIAGIVTLLFTVFFISPKYEAQTSMYVKSSSTSGGNSNYSISSAELSAAQSLVRTYIAILNSRTTLDEVIQKAKINYTYEELKKMLVAEPVNNTEIFIVKVTSENPQEAELIANTIASVLPGRISSVIDGSSVRIVDYAVTPMHKTSPSISKNTLIGAFVGVILACALVFIQFISDTLIHDEDYLINTYHLPILAAIPDLRESGKNSYAHGYGTKQAERRGKYNEKR